MPLASHVKRIEPELLRERVYREIRKAIVDGELRPGERIRDTELALQLGVSRMPVREALARLADEGYVEMSANRWTRVAAVDPGEAQRIYPIVWTLESLAIRLAVEHLDDRAIARMRAANERLRAAIAAGDAVSASTADLELHRTYVDSTRNPELIGLLAELKDKLRRLEVVYFGTSLVAERSADEHDELIDALARRDAERAAAIVTENWRQSLERLTSGQTTKRSREAVGA